MQPATGVILCARKSGDKLEVADDDDLHSSDTVQEKLSLVYRFGVRIYFGAPNKKEFQNIVTTLAETMPTEELLMKANAWELSPWRPDGKNCTAVYRSYTWYQRRTVIHMSDKGWRGSRDRQPRNNPCRRK